MPTMVLQAKPLTNWEGAVRYPMKIKLTDSQESPPESEFEFFEDAFRVQLPGDYKNFLRSANGGIPDRRVFMCEGTDRLIERFLPMLKNPRKYPDAGQYDIGVVMTQLEQRIALDPDELGSKLIPIAYLFAGDFVCLDFRTDSNPSVVVWLHEESRDYAPATITVAQSFTEFCEKLEPMQE